jgi:hypothetical protein
MPTPSAGSHSPGAAAVLAFERLDALPLIRCRTGPDALVTLGLPHPPLFSPITLAFGNTTRDMDLAMVGDPFDCREDRLLGRDPAPSSQELEPPGNPVRFNEASGETPNAVSIGLETHL